MRQIQCLDDDDDDHDYSELQQFLSPDPNRTFIRRGVAMIARVKSTSRLWDSIRSFGRRKRAVSIDSFSSPASARSAADLSGSLEAPSHLSALDPSSLDARPIKVPPYAKFKLLSLYLLSDLVALLDAETNSGSAILKGYIPFQDAVYCPLSHDFGSFLSLTQSTMHHHHSGLTHAWCSHGFSLSLSYRSSDWCPNCAVHSAPNGARLFCYQRPISTKVVFTRALSTDSFREQSRYETPRTRTLSPSST